MIHSAIKMKEGMNNMDETGEHYVKYIKPDRVR